jgi:hypothetical protein
MFLALLAPLLELLRLLIRFFNRLTNLALLLACFDSHRYVGSCAPASRFANSAFGALPVCGSGADLVTRTLMLAWCWKRG